MVKKHVCYILQVLMAFGRPRAALRKKEACSELEGSFFEDFRAKRPRSGPSQPSGTRGSQVKPPREGYLTALRMISTSLSSFCASPY